MRASRVDTRLVRGSSSGSLLRLDRLNLLLRVEGPRENRVTLTLQGVELGAAGELLHQLTVHFGSKRVQAVDPGLQLVDERAGQRRPLSRAPVVTVASSSSGTIASSSATSGNSGSADARNPRPPVRRKQQLAAFARRIHRVDVEEC